MPDNKLEGNNYTHKVHIKIDPNLYERIIKTINGLKRIHKDCYGGCNGEFGFCSGCKYIEDVVNPLLEELKS